MYVTAAKDTQSLTYFQMVHKIYLQPLNGIKNLLTNLITQIEHSQVTPGAHSKLYLKKPKIYENSFHTQEQTFRRNKKTLKTGLTSFKNLIEN